MSEKLVEYFNIFSAYYQKSLFRRIIVGFLIGSLLWGSILILSNILTIFQNDIWFEIFLHDLPLIGTILAFIVTLQIWGLLPQPTSKINENINGEEAETG